MTQAHSVTRGPADPDGSVGAPLNTKTLETIEFIQTPGSSKARQKKFHRHFKQVGNEERVLNCEFYSLFKINFKKETYPVFFYFCFRLFMCISRRYPFARALVHYKKLFRFLF